MNAEPITADSRLIIDFTCTIDDAVDGARAYNRHKPMFGWVWGSVIIVASTVALVLTSSWLWLVLLAFGILTLLAGNLRWLDRALLVSNPQLRLGTRFTLEFTGSGLRYEWAGLLGLIEWSAITEVREDERAIVLLADRAPVSVIPKRAFRTSQDLGAARSMIAARVIQRAPTSKSYAMWPAIAAVMVVVFVTAAAVIYLIQ